MECILCGFIVILHRIEYIQRNRGMITIDLTYKWKNNFAHDKMKFMRIDRKSLPFIISRLHKRQGTVSTVSQLLILFSSDFSHIHVSPQRFVAPDSNNVIRAEYLNWLSDIILRENRQRKSDDPHFTYIHSFNVKRICSEP